MDKKYVYKSTLSRVYGLTPRMVDELGDPDDYCPNPNWQTGPFPASLYSVERVERWVEENRERVEEAKRRRVTRSAAALAARERKRLEWFNTLVVEVTRPLPNTLLDDARKHYGFSGHEDRLREKGLHAYVRHRLTNYHTLLGELRDNRADDYYRLLRERVDEAVRAALLEWRDRQSPLPAT